MASLDLNQQWTMEVPEPSEGVRLDQFVATHCERLSRSAAQRLIATEAVQVNDRCERSNHRLHGGDFVRVAIPPPAPVEAVAEPIPLAIVYEDDHLLVVNKPAGMSTHPSPSEHTGTLVNGLLAHCTLSNLGRPLRPGIVHRLDKSTTGLLVVAKDDATHGVLSAQLEARLIRRGYVALCWGDPGDDAGSIDAAIGRHKRERTKMAVDREGRSAVTHYEVSARYDFLTRVQIRLETGRTHQIRVHFDHVGHAIFGDPVYGGRDKRLKGITPMFRTEALRLLKLIDRQMLHAASLGFEHPDSHETMVLEADLPADFQGVVDRLESLL
jgi:23S rRNA pseudouridine1911/1915/1917 synthase